MKNKNDIPQKLAMVLAQNNQALFFYNCLDTKAQREICNRVNSLSTKKEIEEFIEKISN